MEDKYAAQREHLRSLLETIIKSMVNTPDDIKVQYEVGPRTTLYKVDLTQACIGQVLGTGGKNISGLRTIIAAIASRSGFRAIIEIPFFGKN